MDPSPVSHLYDRYKIGTKQVVDWLVDNARQNYDITELLNLRTSKGTTGASKKKRNKRGHQTGSGLRITLTNQDLLRITEIIVKGSRESIDLQGARTIFKVLDNVIRARSECAEWYNDKDDGHQHFIGVLREILAQLKTLFPNENTQMGNTTKAKQRLENTFTALGVEEPSSAPLGTEPVSKAKLHPVDKLPATTSFQLEQQPDDKSVALCFMFKDCNDIRNSLRETWKDYLKGSITLPTAYQVTHTACALMQCAVDDFVVMARHDSTKGLYMPTHEPKEPTSIQIDLALKRYRSDLCIDAYSALTYLFEWSSIREEGSNKTPQGLSHMSPAYIEGLLSHPLIRALMQMEESLNDLSIDLREHREGHAGRVGHFFYSYIDSRCDDKGPLRLLTVISMQIHMDVCDILGESSGHVFKNTKAISAYVKDSIYDFAKYRKAEELELEKTRNPTGISPECASLLRSIAKGLGPVPRHSKTELSSEQLRSEPIFKHIPLFMGHLASVVSNRWHMQGSFTANCNWAVAGMAHLYRACRLQGYITKPWLDLEFAIEQQGDKGMGLRDSKTLLDAAKHFGLAFGVKLSTYAKKRKPSNERVPLPTMDMATAKRCVAFVIPCETSVATWETGTENETLHAQNARQISYALVKGEIESLKGPAKECWDKTRQLPPQDLLYLLQRKLASQEIATYFDNFKLLQSCMFAFEVVNTIVFEDFSPHKKGWRPLDVVDEILWAAASEKGGKLMLQSIGAAIEKHIEGTESAIYDAAVKMSGGNLPEDMVPGSWVLRHILLRPDP